MIYNILFFALCALYFSFWPLCVFFAPDALYVWLLHPGSVRLFNVLRVGLMNACANALFAFLFPAPSAATSFAAPNNISRILFSSLNSSLWFLSNVLLNPRATWNAFLFYVSLGAYVAPNTVVTTAPTTAQSRVYRAQLEFAFFIALFCISLLSLLSVSYPAVAFVISCFALSAMNEITVNAALASNFLARLANRLGTGVPTGIATPAASPASTTPPQASATPVSAPSPAPSPFLSSYSPWRARPLFDPFTGCGRRAFSSSAFPGAVYEAPPGSHFSAIHFPPNMKSDPAPGAVPFSITESQDYLATRPESFTGPWKSIFFPSISDRDFAVQLSNAIKSLPAKHAYAVLFTAEGKGRYATLGPSFIVTSNSDPDTVLQHLRDNHHFAQENSRGTFNDAIICKWRLLGRTDRIVPDIFRSKVPTKRTTSAKGIVKQTLALPIPHFNLSDIQQAALAARESDRNTIFSRIQNISTELAEARAHLASLSEGTAELKAARSALRTAEYSYKRVRHLPEAASILKAELDEAQAYVNRLTPQAEGIADARANIDRLSHALSRAKEGTADEPLPVAGHPDWHVDSVSSRHLYLSGPNNASIKAYAHPDGHYESFYSEPGQRTINFNDRPYPVTDGPAAFRRELPGGALRIQGGRIVGFEENFSSKRLISTARPNSKAVDITRIITADIEALIVNKRTHLPWVAEWYGVNKDGSDRGGLFKFTDYGNDSTAMLKAFWTSILNQCRGSIVYFHNWAGYDAFHSLNALVLIAEDLGLTIQPMLHNGKVISLKVCELNRTILEVKDSILLCPGPLGSLAKSFQVDCLKGHSPHYFNPMEHGYPDLNYVGPVPAYNFFEPKRTSLAEYQEIVGAYPNNDWNWMANDLRYLHSDCVSLHQVLVKYFSGIQEQFTLNPLQNCTVPGIAFKTWRSSHLTEYRPPVEDLSQSYDPLFRDAYFGGIVDVYRPRVVNGYYYDVNSLYPSAMLNPMPVGLPTLVSLTPAQFLNTNFFGFVKATVRAPANLSIGLLPMRHQGKLLCPGGTFSGLFFSEELRFAIANGYELVSIEYGYSFTGLATRTSSPA